MDEKEALKCGLALSRNHSSSLIGIELRLSPNVELPDQHLFESSSPDPTITFLKLNSLSISSSEISNSLSKHVYPILRNLSVDAPYVSQFKNIPSELRARLKKMESEN